VHDPLEALSDRTVDDDEDGRRHLQAVGGDIVGVFEGVFFLDGNPEFIFHLPVDGLLLHAPHAAFLVIAEDPYWHG
jgi:hypothetical protein